MISILDFGAVGDGFTDDAPAIQAAINAVKPSQETGFLATSAMLYVPPGKYAMGSPVSLYAGVILAGEGLGSLFMQGAGFSGSALFLLSGQVHNTYCFRAGFDNVGFQCSGSVRAIQASAADITNCTFHALTFNAGYCLDLGTYAQGCIIDDLVSLGACDQILHLKGNHNSITGLDKEQGTGSSADPYVLIEAHAKQSAGNIIRRVLIEGTGSVNKSAMVLSGCRDTLLEDLWVELSASDGYDLRISGSTCIRLGSARPLVLTPSHRLKIDTSTFTRAATINIDSVNTQLLPCIDIDSGSDLFIADLYARYAHDAQGLPANITVGRIFGRAGA